MYTTLRQMLQGRQGVGAPPPIPVALQVYDSYTVDPQYQLYFTWFWLSFLALLILLLNSFPILLASLRSKRFFSGWFIYESLAAPAYRQLPSSSLEPTDYESKLGSSSTSDPSHPSRAVDRSSRKKMMGLRGGWLAVGEVWKSVTGFTLPVWGLPTWLGGTGVQDCCRRNYLAMNVGQVVVALIYVAGVWVCVVKDAQLKSNPNRFGFITLAQLTPLMLLATKNNPLSFLVSMSYNHFNWAHRWSGRLVWLCATCHGFSWIAQYEGSPYSSQVLDASKSRRGYVAYGFLCLIAISSIKPIRNRAYALFWTLHFLSFIGFFAAIAYHTPYAQPWIFPPVALYAYDLFARLLKTRIKDAALVPLAGSTLIHIPDVNRGWLPTQHVYIRVLSASWSTFESHPFTILSAPTSSSSTSTRQGITLLAANSGNWTRALHDLASSESELEKKEDTDSAEGAVQVRVIIDGPYGGWQPLGAREVEEVICFAGGSGVSYLIGVAEEAKRIFSKQEEKEGGKLRVVRLVWVTKDFASFHSLLPLFTPLLSPSITISLHLTQHDPRTPLPTSLPPHCTVHALRPSLPLLLSTLLEEDDPLGGVEVLACGPPALVAEVGNAVGAMGVRERVSMGGVEFSGEGFGL